MADNVKKAPARLYVSKAGNAPVRDWLLALSIDDIKKTQQTPKAELDVAIKRKREVDLEK